MECWKMVRPGHHFQVQHDRNATYADKPVSSSGSTAGIYNVATPAEHRRRDDLPFHPGQVCFPGGAREGDEDAVACIKCCDRALELDPDNEDAAFNRDLLQQLLEQQAQQEQQGGQQESSDQTGGESEESDGENESESESSDGSPQADSEGQEQDGSGREQEMSEEDMQALQEELQRAAEEAQQSEQEMQQLSQEELEALRRAQEEQQAMEQWPADRHITDISNPERHCELQGFFSRVSAAVFKHRLVRVHQ